MTDLAAWLTQILDEPEIQDGAILRPAKHT